MTNSVHAVAVPTFTEKAVYIALYVLPTALFMLAVLAFAFWLHWLLGIAFFVFLWHWTAGHFWHEWTRELSRPTARRKP